MKPLYFLSCFSLLLILFAFQIQVSAQAVADPLSLNVYKTMGSITLDGQLNEPDWYMATGRIT
jgi:hypothetical protein